MARKKGSPIKGQVKKKKLFQAGDKESAPTWREFFKDLKKRGLDGSKIFHLPPSV